MYVFQLDPKLKEDEVIGYEAAIGLVDWQVALPATKLTTQHRTSNGT